MSGSQNTQQGQGGHGSYQQSGQTTQQEYAQQTGSGSSQFQGWVQFWAIAFAIAGVGMALFGILIDAIEEGIIEEDAAAASPGAIPTEPGAIQALGLALTPMAAAPLLALFGAVFLGIALGWVMRTDEQTVFKTAGVAGFLGTFVFWVISALLLGFIVLPDGASLDFGGLLINAAIAGLVAGAVAVGGSWTVRNQYPS